MSLAQGTQAPDTQLASPGRVLLVDDQPELRRLFRRSLVKLGHEVVESCNGRAAVELARKAHFDLVISDLRMPDMDGLELLRELAELEPDLPVVLISGGLDEQAEQAALEYGAFAFLMKPFAFEQLGDYAARAIARRRRSAQAREQYEPYASMQRLKIPMPPELDEPRKG